jgi:hypothetical protein
MTIEKKWSKRVVSVAVMVVMVVPLRFRDQSICALHDCKLRAGRDYRCVRHHKKVDSSKHLI